MVDMSSSRRLGGACAPLRRARREPLSRYAKSNPHCVSQRRSGMRSRLGLVLLIAAACGMEADRSAAQAPGARDTIDVLFIGNSLTYYNSVPEMVSAISGGTS